MIPRRLIAMHDMRHIISKPLYPNARYNICVLWKKGRPIKKPFRQIQDVILSYFKNDDE